MNEHFHDFYYNRIYMQQTKFFFLFCEILEKISGVKVDDQKLEVAGHMKYYQDITLIKKLINWEPQYSLDEGLTKTFNTMKEYYKEPSVKEYINQNL